MCDMDWTSEAIGNLVKNALDHTEIGGIIKITWESTPTMIRNGNAQMLVCSINIYTICSKK